jgi:beta-glucosidase
MGAIPDTTTSVAAAPAVEPPVETGVFGSDFVWGVATAAYQIEGAVDVDGRGKSIWDTFSHSPGNVLEGDTGDVACDHYHRWRDDLRLLRELGLGAYRFSIAWPRIVPDGKSAPNSAGLDWYERLVDALLAADIEPYITLYHWDLPQPLEDAGGWPERATADAFARYAELVGARLGDRVRNWITINEPWCCAFLGYGSGEHAPGRRDPKLALAASHTLLLAHGRAVQVLRATNAKARIGITLNPVPVEPASDHERDLAATRRLDGQRNRWFLDPLYGRGYPSDMLEHFGNQFAPPSTDDLALIAAPTDFLGVNYYEPNIARADDHEPFLRARTVQPEHAPLTDNAWVVRPSGLRQLLTRLARDYPVRQLAVTENGAAYNDPPPQDGRVADTARTRYLAGHVAELGRAIKAGVPVSGYFVWSFLDNFEWARGYADRFGLVHVDYATQRRTLKESGRWYRSLIAAARGQAASI